MGVARLQLIILLLPLASLGQATGDPPKKKKKNPFKNSRNLGIPSQVFHSVASVSFCNACPQGLLHLRYTELAWAAESKGVRGLALPWLLTPSAPSACELGILSVYLKTFQCLQYRICVHISQKSFLKILIFKTLINCCGIHIWHWEAKSGQEMSQITERTICQLCPDNIIGAAG